SHPRELIAQARALGLAAIGLADRNTLAGVVRAHVAAREAGLRLLVGCRLAFTDGTELIVFPRDRAAYGRLCRLLSTGKTGAADGPRVEKGETRLGFDQAVAFGEGLVALVPAPERPDPDFETRLEIWRRAWPDRLYLAAAPLHRGDDRARLNRLADLARRADAPLLATNAVLYHHRDRRRLQDVLTCVHEGSTIDDAGLRLQANAERHLKSPAEMARLFRGHEEALTRTLEVLQACRFSLDELAYEYPDDPVPAGGTAQRLLIALAVAGARERWGDRTPPHVIATLVKELRLIRQL